jgi:outer membrane protein
MKKSFTFSVRRIECQGLLRQGSSCRGSQIIGSIDGIATLAKASSRIMVVIILLFFQAEAFSQKIRVLNLREAVSLAAKNNSELVNAIYDRMKAEQKVSEVYSENLVPTMTLNSRYTRALKKQRFIIFGETFEVGSDNSLLNIIDITEPLPVLGTPVFSGIKIAEYYTRFSQENVRQVSARVKADVTKSYLTVQLSKDVIEVNEASLTNASENLRVVEARYKAGVNTEFDYLRAKVKVETLKPALKQSQNNLEISKKVLKNKIGLKTDEDVDVTGSLSYDSTEVFGNTDMLLTKIVNNNVLVRQLRINKQINEELVRVDEANFYPKLYVFGQYSLQAQENDDKPLSRYGFFNTANAGLGLSLDLNFWKNQYKQNQTKIEVKKNEEDILRVKEALKTQSQSVLLRIEDAKNRIAAMVDNIALAERGLELANISFKSGVINQIDVLDAELSLSQVRLGYIQAVYDYLVARTDLEQLLEK